MFSLNSLNTQNQILVNVNQLAARYSCIFKQRKQNSSKNSHVKRKENATSLYDATLCSESLEEAVRNFDKNDLAEMRKVDLRSLATLSKATRRSLNFSKEFQSAKKVSFISAETFDKNKNGWTPQSSTTPTVTVDLRRHNTRISLTDNFVGLLARSLQKDTFQYSVQVRGFKTERGVHADQKRNPNLINRLRKFFGQYGKSDSKENLEEDYQEHLQRKIICQAEKDKDKIRANTDDSFMSITMDLQAVLQMPSGGESILYYMRKLVLYNFTIYEAKLPNNAYCLCWSELNGKKGSSEIGTCLYYYLSKELPPNIKEISIFSDTCSGQNRNQYISALLLWAVQKIENLDVIEQKFLESGHTHMEVDSMHAAIETASKNKTINSVNEWKNVFKAARKKRTKTITKGEIKETIEIDNYKVKEFKFNEMLDLKNLGVGLMRNKNKDNMNETVNWLKIKRMKYIKGDLKIYFNYDMSEDYRTIDVCKMPVNTSKTRAKRNSNPPSVNVQLPEEIELLYSSQLPISIAKKKDLLNMCEKQIIPEELLAWIRDMKTYTKQPAFESDEE
ncbi:hypothetical protein evm_012668 [Chilo suppressalis]|nr:hypothetical protein evm_012668 [Chilo suppressalis]